MNIRNTNKELGDQLTRIRPLQIADRVDDIESSMNPTRAKKEEDEIM